MAARRAIKDPTTEEYVPSEAEKEADAAALKQLGSKGGVEVDLDDDDDDDDEEPAAAAAPSRQENRRQRKRIIDENEQLRREAAESKAAASQALGFAQGLAQQVQRAPAGPQVDPFEAEENALRAEQDLLVREFELKKDKLTAEEAKSFKDRAWAFEGKKASLHQRKYAPVQPNPGQDPSLLLAARYPDVMSDERAKTWAFSRYNQRMIETGRNDWELRDSVVEEAREMFRMKPARRDDREPAMRRKLQGTSKGGSGATGDSPTRIQLTPQQVKEADIAFPNDPNRYKRYARLNSQGR